MAESNTSSVPSLSDGLSGGNPLRWLRFFGPGAIIASLTIGTGELIFSSRGGAIFGYRILWVFVLISFLKWGLVYATGRHMILSGAHPFERWARLPGPHGWLPILMLLLAVPAFPIWISFHASVLGTLGHHWLRWDPHVGGAGALTCVLVLVLAGGYRTLERVQLAVVATMLLGVVVSLVLLRPDWPAMVEGLLVPRPLAYPDWLATIKPDIAKTPVWIEATVYAAVVGGASYDYLAYVSFLRDKGWGLAGESMVDARTLRVVADDPNHLTRRWLRALRADTVTSFAAVVVFTMVFVAMGAVVLAPQRKIPDNLEMLNLQAEFLTRLHGSLLPLYVAGATLTMLGTLYGTIEVAPRVVQEVARAVAPTTAQRCARQLRMAAVGWCALGAYAALGWNYYHGRADLDRFIAPAALFTGLLSCGLVCLLAPWADRRFLPPSLCMHRALAWLSRFAGIVFIGLGLKGYWDYAQAQSLPTTIGILVALAAAVVIAAVAGAHYGRVQSMSELPAFGLWRDREGLDDSEEAALRLRRETERRRTDD